MAPSLHAFRLLPCRTFGARFLNSINIPASRPALFTAGPSGLYIWSGTPLKQANPDVSSVDMEAFRVARRFSKERIPFIIAKAVSDEWNFKFHDFEFLFNNELKTNLARFLSYCIRYPQEIPNLLNFLGNANKALKNNIRFIESFLDILI